MVEASQHPASPNVLIHFSNDLPSSSLANAQWAHELNKSEKRGGACFFSLKKSFYRCCPYFKLLCWLLRRLVVFSSQKSLINSACHCCAVVTSSWVTRKMFTFLLWLPCFAAAAAAAQCTMSQNKQAKVNESHGVSWLTDTFWNFPISQGRPNFLLSF